MSEVVWEEPPSSPKGNHGIWAERLTPLQDRPNAWARVAVTPTVSTAHKTLSNLRHRLLRYPPGRWEFKAGKFEDGGAIWARYLGPEE